jgi:hypothetical protein
MRQNTEEIIAVRTPDVSTKAGEHPSSLEQPRASSPDFPDVDSNSWICQNKVLTSTPKSVLHPARKKHDRGWLVKNSSQNTLFLQPIPEKHVVKLKARQALNQQSPVTAEISPLTVTPERKALLVKRRIDQSSATPGKELLHCKNSLLPFVSITEVAGPSYQTYQEPDSEG